MQISIFIATSLDGFISRPDGAIDWLPAEPSGEDYGYERFITSVDTLIMGRKTYEQVLSFPNWPYGALPVVVLTTRALHILPSLARTVTTMSGTPSAIVQTLEAQGVKHVYVDGGVTIQNFLAADLITQLTITTIPILIGRGIPLFGPSEHDIPLKHLAGKSYPNGFTQNTYEVISPLK